MHYNIKDGERPDIVSQRLYSSTNYYWTFFLINDSLHDGLGSWPMSMQDLNQYIDYLLENNLCGPNEKRKEAAPRKFSPVPAVEVRVSAKEDAAARAYHQAK